VKSLTIAVLLLLAACTTAAMRPWTQAQRLDEPSCLASCDVHDQQCPQIFAAFPERGAIECPASHADCVKGCQRAGKAVAAPVKLPSAPTNTSKEEKLRELKRLYEQGLVTDEVYKARQLAILSEP
jgi:hypothetical protein